ncbi:hypothetical protein BDQ12DRAFT_680186 [Crucibulum laeve]|uniref:Uncharacterized protein n=1 Tax=Crucibulum laeve TaxID=68775 RepID=A0A5C3M695_9AGAR|nr:hypothetical protein BDQ12DRAFT_680186 [Crucibulum laeve]
MDVSPSHETRTDLSDSSSRIMVLASALELTAGFIHIFQENLKPKLPRTSTQEGSEPPHVNMHVLKNGSGPIITVPWSIKNKYYSAEVHFASLAIPGLSSHLFTSVPAVIFIWTKGEVSPFFMFIVDAIDLWR